MKKYQLNRRWFEISKLLIRLLTILTVVVYTIVVDWSDEFVNKQTVHYVILKTAVESRFPAQHLNSSSTTKN